MFLVLFVDIFVSYLVGVFKEKVGGVRKKVLLLYGKFLDDEWMFYGGRIYFKEWIRLWRIV